jgi:hypothetical protein
MPNFAACRACRRSAVLASGLILYVSVQHGTNIPLLQLRNIDDQLGGYLSSIAPLIRKVIVLHVCSALRNLQSGVLSLVRLLHEKSHWQHIAPVKEA